MLSKSPGNSQNLLTQSGEDDSYAYIAREVDMEDNFPLQVDDEEGTLSVVHAPLWLKRGDLVEYWMLGEPTLAIFIKNFESGKALFYTERGSWLFRRTRHSLFSVSGFAEPRDLEALLPLAPSDESTDVVVDRLQPMSIHSPRDAGSKALEKMRRFQIASDSLYRKHAERLNRAYDFLAPGRASEGRKYISLQDATMQIMQKKSLSQLTPVMLWTVHRTLCKMQNISTDWHTHRLNPEFELVPKQNLDHINRVKEWVREFQETTIEKQSMSRDGQHASENEIGATNPIVSFVEKARTAVLASRQIRSISPAGYIGPSPNKINPSESEPAIWKVIQIGTLNGNDKTILHYMDAWVTSRYLNRMTNYPALGPLVLRAVGLYDRFDLDQSTGFTFLQELGIVAPWQNRSLYLTRFGLPGHDPSQPITVARSEAQQQLTGFDMKDSMAQFRKDWGDLPVYCIDSADTIERDDGVSLEEVGEETWVHIHVANPSAFIQPKSAFARYAARLSESVYLPELKYPMLDPMLSKEHFSLGIDRPCITFSAKIDADGEVIGSAISHGIVHNVHYITPQRLEEELGLGDGSEKHSATLLTVGGVMPDVTDEIRERSPCSDRPLGSADLQALHKLRSVAKAIQRRRERNGALMLGGQSTLRNLVSPRVFFGQGVNDEPRPLSNSIQRFDGDPIISIIRNTEGVRSILTLVAELMILAGQVCADWCRERHIPIPYRGIRVNPEPYFSRTDFKRDVIDPQLAKQGSAEDVDLIKYMRALGLGDCSASPLEHVPLSLPAYTKATSPLRRYSDLLAHWQVEAAIRHETNKKSSLKDIPSKDCLPFSYEEVEIACKRIVARGGQISNVSELAISHWYDQAFFRAFYFNEAPLPDVFTVKVLDQGDVMNRPRGHLVDWGRRVQLDNRNAAGTRLEAYQVGDVWEMKIREIHLYSSSVIMEPLRRLSRNTDLLNSGG